MDENIFKYVLEITGLDNRIRSDANGNPIPHMEFRETNYFPTLREAVESLLLRDIRKFERSSPKTDNDRYHDYAAIRTIADKEHLLEIVRLSFEDTPDGFPEAGIYMNFCDNTTKDFEQLTGYDFSGFSSYDPESPFLQLASYVYDKGLKIFVDDELIDLAGGLKLFEQSQMYDDEWYIKVSSTRNHFDSPALLEITNYHYPWMQEAFIHLLATEIREMDKHIAEELNGKSWIMDAHLSERGASKLIELLAAIDPSNEESITEPGIYLKFHTAIKNMEGESGIGLAQLGNYNQDSKYLLLANYDENLNRLLPHPGHLSLLASLNIDQPLYQQSIEQVPYHLRLTWEAPPSLNKDISYPQQQVTQISCSCLDEALLSMKQLDELFLDEMQALRLRHPIYVKQADIIDPGSNSVIISKFQISEDNRQIPSGIYIKIDESYVSVEMLKLLRAHLKDDTQPERLQFLITREQTHQQTSSNERARQTHRFQRTRTPPDNAESKGLKP